jgi:hypothetical protein
MISQNALVSLSKNAGTDSPSIINHQPSTIGFPLTAENPLHVSSVDSVAPML